MSKNSKKEYWAGYAMRVGAKALWKLGEHGVGQLKNKNANKKNKLEEDKEYLKNIELENRRLKEYKNSPYANCEICGTSYKSIDLKTFRKSERDIIIDYLGEKKFKYFYENNCIEASENIENRLMCNSCKANILDKLIIISDEKLKAFDRLSEDVKIISKNYKGRLHYDMSVTTEFEYTDFYKSRETAEHKIREVAVLKGYNLIFDMEFAKDVESDVYNPNYKYSVYMASGKLACRIN